MATLQELNASMQGETLTAPTVSGNTLYPQNGASVGTQEYVIFRLLKKKKGRTYVDGVCDGVRNPNTGRIERIWLLNGADSIWQSELVELFKDPEYKRRNRRSLTFEDGVCRIKVNDERALEYARANIHNVGKRRVGNGKFDYYEYNAAEEQQERLKKQMLKINMVIKAKEMPEDKMMKLASYFGIMPYDELGQLKGPDGMRSELMLRADTQPELFEKYIDSKEVEISYLVKQAIVGSKIDFEAQSGNALWANGKGFICKIPQTRKHYEYLTELAMTNSPEGKQFLEQLQTFAS